MTTLLHYSEKPLTVMNTVEQTALNRGDKPFGLWVSVEGEDDWASWCRSENFSLHRLCNVTEVHLDPKARILTLTCAFELDAFTEQYRDDEKPDYYRGRCIRWGDVAREYHGIIIAPYQWSRRLHDNTSWYYGWDCASGCIWDATAVAALRARTGAPA